MGSIYAQPGASSGSVYAKPGEVDGTTAPTAPKKSGGGILGDLEHVAHSVGQSLERSGRTALAIPGGLISQANTAVVQPWKNLVTTGHPYAHGAGKKIDELIQQQADSIGQTLSRPGHDPLATAMLVSPLLHGAGRVVEGATEAGKAVKAGEGVTGAVKAAAKPNLEPRLLKQGAKETSLIPSRNAGGRVVQRTYDKVVRKALTKNEAGQATGPVAKRVAAHGAARIGGALDEEMRTQQKMRAVPADMLDKAAAKLSKLPAKRRQEQAALELTSTQTAPLEAAQYHLDQAAKGVNPGLNKAVARLYQNVAKRDLVHLDETKPAGEKVFVNPAHEALAKTDAALAPVQMRGDRILEEKGVRSGEALTTRRNAPGQIRAGAVYEKPTPGKQGVASQALVKARARVERLQVLHDRALSRNEAASAAADTSYRGGHTAPDPEFSATMDDLTANGMFPKDIYSADAARLYGHGGNHSAIDQTAIRKINQVKGNPDAMVKVYRAVPKEITSINPGDWVTPTLAYARGHMAGSKDWHVISREVPAGELHNDANSIHEYGWHPANPAHIFDPTSDRLGGALSVAKDELQRLEAAAAARVKPTGIVGGETARPGRGFVSERVSEKKLGKAEASASTGQTVGAAKLPIDSKTYTGRALEQGFRPKHVSAAASSHFRQIIKFVNTDARRRASLETGSQVKRSARDVLVRDPDLPAGKIDAAVRQALGQERPTVDTADELAAHDAAVQEGLRAAHQLFVEHIVPGIKDKFASDRVTAVGTKAPDGFRWVDRKTLGELGQPQAFTSNPVAAAIGRQIDNVNSAVTALTVYFKIGHVGTRVLTNAATNIIQGSTSPKQLAHSWKLWHSLADEEKARALAAAGQHGFAALPTEGANIIGQMARGGAKFWAKHADAPFRFNSLAYELRKADYKTPAQFQQALDHIESGGQGMPAHEWAKLSAAVRRADREAIAYDRLSPFEKRYISRGIWFYPWVKGSTLFTLRTILEHPYKAGALGLAGTQGRKQQEQQLGPTPTYEAGLIPFSGGSRPIVSDFSTFSPFATPADLTEALTHPGGIAGQFNPVLGAAGQAAYGLNQYGGPSKSYLDALMALGSATPEQQVAEAVAAQGKDQSNRMFSKTPLSTIERYLVGPAMPRRVNKAALAKAAARERSGNR